MFGNCQLGPTNLGFPDVCLTPLAAGIPVPIPYPNMTNGATGLPPAVTVLYEGGPAHNVTTMEDLSLGDQPGVELGVASALDMGPKENLVPSFTVFHEGLPATKLTTVTLHNGTNAPGLTLIPAQFKVLILS